VRRCFPHLLTDGLENLKIRERGKRKRQQKKGGQRVLAAGAMALDQSKRQRVAKGKAEKNERGKKKNRNGCLCVVKGALLRTHSLSVKGGGLKKSHEGGEGSLTSLGKGKHQRERSQQRILQEGSWKIKVDRHHQSCEGC